MYGLFLKDSFKLVITKKNKDIIERGFLKNSVGSVPIKDFIPRFYDEDYCDSFSLQWSKFRNVQMDSKSGHCHSLNRFLGSTKWSLAEFKGKSVLECGCGPGRFTEIFLRAGANVVAVDMSKAIDVNRENNGDKKNLLLIQGDITNLPFFHGKFDYVFCHGVLQHTPDPEFTFNYLLKYLKSGGKISVDSYRKVFVPTGWSTPKYLCRPITKRMDKNKLLKLIQWYIPKYIDFDSVIRGIPKIGVILTGLIPIPCWNYLNKGYSRDERIEHAIMDTFDALSPTYDNPKTIGEIRKFFIRNGKLKNVDVFSGYNGVVGNGVRK
jgi:SAM-dependent methyltransferase